jgi:MFS family permease
VRSGGIGGGVSARVVALLTLAAFINYVDRGNLATAGPLIRDQLGLSNTQLGFLLSAFFWSYAPGQLPAGWLAERVNARLVLACGLAVWGVATALTGLATGFIMLLVLRVTLGIGESVMYPASFKILAREALSGQLGRANGWMAAGQLSGPAFGTLAGGLLMVWLGWRVVFFVFGCASLLWLWPWLRTPRAAAPQRSPGPKDSPSALMILRRRELWGSCLGYFCQAYALYLVLSWLPVYLVKARGFSMTEMAQIGAQSVSPRRPTGNRSRSPTAPMRRTIKPSSTPFPTGTPHETWRHLDCRRWSRLRGQTPARYGPAGQPVRRHGVHHDLPLHG